MMKFFIIYLISLTLFSCVSKKHILTIESSKGFIENVYKSINSAKDREFLIRVKLLYAILLNKSGEIMGAYTGEERLLEQQEFINEIIEKGGKFIYG